MNQCKKCHSYALNLWQQGIETDGLCDLCYYRRENAHLRARLKWKEQDYELLSGAFNTTCDYVKKLHMVIKMAEFSGDFCDDHACPWCCARAHERHRSDCPAFISGGNVR